MKLSDMKKRMETLSAMKKLIELRSDTTDNPNPEYVKYPKNIINYTPEENREYYKNQRIGYQKKNEALRNILTNYPESMREDLEEKFNRNKKSLPVGLKPHSPKEAKRMYMLRRDSGDFNPDLTDEQLETAFKILVKKRNGKYDPDYGRALLRKKKARKAKTKRKPVKKCRCK
jgi:hypothetical protein